MSNLQADRNPVEVLADEFAQRVRNGESPVVSEYAQRYPEHADEINELFPSIVVIERLKRQETASRLQSEQRMKIGGRRLERVGDYRIVREVGRGGMGVVFEAVQTSLDRRVALKVLSDRAITSSKQVQRFEREARAAAALHHTNIVPVFGVGHEDDLHFYVMQYIHGVGLDKIVAALRTLARQQADSSGAPSGVQQQGSQGDSAFELARALRTGSFAAPPQFSSSFNSSVTDDNRRREAQEEKPRGQKAELTTSLHGPRPAAPAPSTDPPQGSSGDPPSAATEPSSDVAPAFGLQFYKGVARLAMQVAHALSYAHAQGVLHRDIKPANLLLDPQGTLWVTDFGLAKVTEHQELTNTGDIVGTLRYMAPEQFDGQFDARGDLYSLGLTLYELLTLRPACDDTAIRNLLKQHSSDSVVRPRAVNPSIPRDLETIVLKAISADPKDRYQSADALAEDLERFLNELPILARRVTPIERLWRWRKRNPAIASLSAAAFTLLILVAGVTSYAYFRSEHQRRQSEHQRRQIAEANERAEANLQLALDAFEGIMENITSRGTPESFDLEAAADGEQEEEEEQEVEHFETVVTPADAELLQGLLEFFDQFARQNSANLQEETAKAYRRMGALQRRLGERDAAKEAYREALRLQDGLLAERPGDVPLLIAQAETLNELAQLEWQERDFGQARQRNQQARELLRNQPAEIANLPRVRLALVQTCLGIFPPRPGGDLPSQGGASRRRRDPSERREDQASSTSTRQSQRGDSGLSYWKETLDRALEVLCGLRKDDPENRDYRLLLAKAYQIQLRMDFYTAQYEGAAEAGQQSLELLEQLAADFPNQPTYRFELAGTLSMVSQLPEDRQRGDDPQGGAKDQRFERAEQLAQELVEQFPSVPEYRFLWGKCLERIARRQAATGRADDALNSFQSAVARLQEVAGRYPTIHTYREELADAKRYLGNFLRRQGQLEESRRVFEDAIGELRVEAQQTPDHFRRSFFSRELGKLYYGLEQTLLEQGEKELAAEARQNREDLFGDRGRRGRRRGRGRRN